MSELVLDNERRREVSDHLDLSFAKIRALRRIAKRPMPMGELATLLVTDPPYVTLLVDDLEKRGLVERRPHPTDRRAKLVVATRSGIEAAQRAQKIMARPPAELADLSSGDTDELRRILHEIHQRRQERS